jgi:DNA repair photolyase
MFAGIAKAARDGAALHAKRRVEYRELPTKHLLNRCASERVPFEWTINPYRGCEYGCQYCYARYTHEFLEYPDARDFERRIFVKQWTPEALRAELRQVRPGQWIALGTATDAYQPAERVYGRTRAVLELLAGRRGLNLGITTKSDLVARDARLLAEVARSNRLRVTMTVTTLDAGLARALEPLAPRPGLRLEALARLARAGVECGVTVSPVLPGITDARRSLETIAAAAVDAGARYFMGHAVFLRPSAAAVFLPFVDREFPDLARAYRRRFERAAYPREEYSESLRTTLVAIRAKYGLGYAAYWQPAVEQGVFDFTAGAAAPIGMRVEPPTLLRVLPACAG